MQQILLTEDSLTSLRWHDPDQVQRVVLFQDSQFKNTPSGRDKSRLFHISDKSRTIDLIIKKSNMHIMFPSSILRVLSIVLLFALGGCATGPDPINPYFEMPPERIPKAELDLYNRALVQLKNNQLDNSIDLWKRFLEHSPRSFRGYNNLGMALYSNDQLLPSIEAFETALVLEPFDPKIKNNLKRALRFQVTILRENKDYATAIKHLEKVKKLTDLEEKEKVALEIETLQDLIYEQVKRANTLEDYEAFVAKYPDNPTNSDEARRLIAKMKPQESTLGEFPEMHSEILPEPAQRTTSSMPEVIVPEPMQGVPTLPPVRKESIEIVAEVPKTEEEQELSEEMQETEMQDPVMEEEPTPPVVKQSPVKEVAVDPDMEMKREKPAPPVKKEPTPKRSVRIMTKEAPLRVRAEPDVRSKVLAQIPKGSVVPVFQEGRDWFQIEYQRGKKGWISKKYSQLIKK
jgi:tetratricopeptide (TPR) repeat protein